MALVVAQGVVEVTADTKGIPRQIAKDIDDGQDAVKGAGTRTGKNLFGAVIGAGALIAGASVVTGFLGDAVSGASDLTETVSKSKTIFGDYFGNIDVWTDRSAKTLGLSKQAALDAATGFGNMFTQLGFGGQKAADLSRAVVQTAADLGSFNNLETGDVADRMAAAFRGEYDSLQALIPNINAARVEQEAMAASGKTNASELTAQEKAAAVLAIVQKDGAAAMGDFAKTADGAANTQKTLTATMEEQQAALGSKLMPIWQGFLGFLSTTVVPILTTVVDWIGKNTSWLTPLAIGLGVVTAAFALLNVVMNLNPFTLVVTAIGLLVGALIWVATETTFFQDTFRITGEVVSNVMRFMGDVIGNVGRFIGDVVRNVGVAFVSVWFSYIKPTADFVTGAFNAIGSAVRNVFGGIGSFIGDVFRNIVGVIRGPINTVIGFLNKAIDGANVVGGAFGVSIPRIPMLARGGQITGSGSVIVGERGPEVLNLPRGASVVPLTSGQRSQGAGSRNVSVELTVKSDDPTLAGRQFARALTARMGI